MRLYPLLAAGLALLALTATWALGAPPLMLTVAGAVLGGLLLLLPTPSTRRPLSALLGAFVVALLPLAASAQAVGDELLPVITPDDTIWTILLKALVTVVLTVAIPALVRVLQRNGVQIDERHTRQFQLTVANAAAIYMDPHTTSVQKREQAIAYVKSRAADAVAAFRADDEAIWLGIEAAIAWIRLGRMGLPELGNLRAR